MGKVEPEGADDDPRHGDAEGKDEQQGISNRQCEEIAPCGGIAETDAGEGGMLPVVTPHPGPEPEPVEAEGGDGQEEGEEVGAAFGSPFAAPSRGG